MVVMGEEQTRQTSDQVSPTVNSELPCRKSSDVIAVILCHISAFSRTSGMFLKQNENAPFNVE